MEKIDREEAKKIKPKSFVASPANDEDGDYYLAALIGAIDEKDIPKNAKIKNQAIYDQLQEKKKPKKTVVSKPAKKMTHAEKVGIPQSMAKISDIVV